MPRVTSLDKVRAWREKYLAEIALLSGRLSELMGDAKKFRSDAMRVLDRVVQSADKMRGTVDQGAEDRRSEIYAHLVEERGEAVADAMMADPSPEDERDEATCGQLDELSVPDAEGEMSSAIASLEALQDGLGELLSGIRDVK